MAGNGLFLSSLFLFFGGVGCCGCRSACVCENRNGGADTFSSLISFFSLGEKNGGGLIGPERTPARSTNSQESENLAISLERHSDIFSLSLLTST